MGIGSCIPSALVVILSWSTGWAQEGSDFDAWLKKDHQAFQGFKDERDRQFLEFLQRDWQEYQAFQGLVRDQVPKPLTLPVAEPQAPPPPVESKIVEIPSPVAPPAFPAPPAPLPTSLQHPVHLVFYGDSLAVSCGHPLTAGEWEMPITRRLTSAAWMLALSLAACGPAKVDLTPPPSDKSLDNMPSWMMNPPDEPGYLFSTATATSQDMQMAIDKAKTAAQAQLAQQLETRLENLTKNFQEETGLAVGSQLLSIGSFRHPPRDGLP